MTTLADYGKFGLLWPFCLLWQFWPITAIWADYSHFVQLWTLCHIMALCGRFVLFYKLCKYLTTNTEKNLKILKYQKVFATNSSKYFCGIWGLSNFFAVFVVKYYLIICNVGSDTRKNFIRYFRVSDGRQTYPLFRYVRVGRCF